MNTHLVLHHRIADILNCTTELIRILNIIAETLTFPCPSNRARPRQMFLRLLVIPRGKTSLLAFESVISQFQSLSSCFPIDITIWSRST